nr:Miv-CC peptide [Microhodotermes viator]
EINFTPNW